MPCHNLWRNGPLPRHTCRSGHADEAVTMAAISTRAHHQGRRQRNAAKPTDRILTSMEAFLRVLAKLICSAMGLAAPQP